MDAGESVSLYHAPLLLVGLKCGCAGGFASSELLRMASALGPVPCDLDVVPGRRAAKLAVPDLRHRELLQHLVLICKL